MMKALLWGTTLFLCTSSPLWATSGKHTTASIDSLWEVNNDRNVTVKVNDKTGPIIGANVLVKGTSIGGITDLNGIIIMIN